MTTETQSMQQWQEFRRWVYALQYGVAHEALEAVAPQLTEQQLNAACGAVGRFAECKMYGTNYELKRISATVGASGTLYVQATVGMVNDEGTMAAALCRNSMHIAVGKRGGVRAAGSRSRKAWTPWGTEGNTNY